MQVDQEKFSEVAKEYQRIELEISKVVSGLEPTIQSIFVALLSGGHVLLEGMPGLAKTLLAKTVASALDLNFGRVQFTPDLLPADLTGTLVFNPKENQFETKRGPIFTNVLLADEINRAPAKVQSALLQSMEEKQITLGDKTYPLQFPFFVLATQNPVELEGTYPLPEAQLDRFLFKLEVPYPSFDVELSILNTHGNPGNLGFSIEKKMDAQGLQNWLNLSEQVFVEDKLKEYIVSLCQNSRPNQTKIAEIKHFLKSGVSPRATLALLRSARATAVLEGRNFIVPEDIRKHAHAIIKHRITLSMEAYSEEISTTSLVELILTKTEVP